MPTHKEMFDINTAQALNFMPVLENSFMPYSRATTANPNCSNIVGPYRSYMALPAVPLIHPYDPNGNLHNQRIDAGIPIFPVVAHLISAQQDQIAAEFGVAHVDLFLVMQNNPWKNVPLLFRPHPWLHATAPELQADLNIAAKVEVGFDYKKTHFESLGQQDVSTHTGEANYTVFSPDNMALNPEYTHYNNTSTFYSFCVDRANNRVAITLHVLLNDHDLNIVQNFCVRNYNQQSTLLDLLRFLSNQPCNINTQAIVYFCSGFIPPLAKSAQFNEFLEQHKNSDGPFDPENVDTENQQRILPMEIAVIEHNAILTQYLLKCGANVEKLHEHVVEEHNEDVDGLLESLNKLRI